MKPSSITTGVNFRFDELFIHLIHARRGEPRHDADRERIQHVLRREIRDDVHADDAQQTADCAHNDGNQFVLDGADALAEQANQLGDDDNRQHRAHGRDVHDTTPFWMY